MLQINISNAFLHGNLEETILIRQPVGFMDEERPDHVCLLKKSLYGLKHASWIWFQCLRDFLQLIGFEASQSDPFVFIRSKEEVTYILVYVDDMSSPDQIVHRSGNV